CFSPRAPTRRPAPASTTSPPRSRRPKQPALPKARPFCARPWRTAMDTEDLTFRWHDNVIYGLGFDRGEPDEDDWRSDLRLDIDFIEEWLSGAPGDVQFKVAPATLTFHDVADLAIAVDQGDSGGRNALCEWS